MVVDDHPMWRDAVERDLPGRRLRRRRGGRRRAPGAGPLPRGAPRRSWCSTCRSPAPTASRSPARCSSRTRRRRVLILSASGEQDDVLEAVKAGATGYLVKSASREELLDAVRRVAAGRHRLHPGPGRAWCWASSAGWPTRRAPTAPDARAHRARDRGAQMVAKGMSYKQIAERLVHLAPHRAEPRAEHPAQAADAQPRRAHPLRDRAGSRRGVTWRRAGSEDAVALTELERVANLAALAHVFDPERHPFPFDDVLARWVLVLDDPEVLVDVVDGDATGCWPAPRTTRRTCATSWCVPSAGAPDWDATASSGRSRTSGPPGARRTCGAWRPTTGPGGSTSTWGGGPPG